MKYAIDAQRRSRLQPDTLPRCSALEILKQSMMHNSQVTSRINAIANANAGLIIMGAPVTPLVTRTKSVEASKAETPNT